MKDGVSAKCTGPISAIPEDSALVYPALANGIFSSAYIMPPSLEAVICARLPTLVCHNTRKCTTRAAGNHVALRNSYWRAGVFEPFSFGESLRRVLRLVESIHF
jgi:hypothetical protein